MEYKFEALQTIHKGETMKKKWQKNLEEVMLLLVAGKEKKAKLECGVLSELHMKTWKKKEEKKDMNEGRKKKYSKKEENEFATARWQFVRITYTKFHQNQSQNMEISDRN